MIPDNGYFSWLKEQAVPANRIRPWWCTCDSGEDSKGAHKPECMGNQPAFPRLTAALAKNEKN